MEYVSLDFRELYQELGRLPLPLKRCLNNTRFRATDEGLPHLEYSGIRGPSPKAPAEKLESEPIAP